MFTKLFANAFEVQVKRTKSEVMVSKLRMVLALGLPVVIAKPLPMFLLDAEG